MESPALASRRSQTIAERADKRRKLGASFFFTRNEGERATAEHFFPAIAFQLACRSQEFAIQLCDEIEKHPDVVQKSIQQQVASLLLNPLQRLDSLAASSFLIIIDALDECQEDEAETLLTLLAQHIPRMPQLKLFITTRPEWHIRDLLSRDGNHELFRLHEIEDFIVQSDIRLYLDFSLSGERIQRAFPHLRPPWQPTAKDMDMLCGICGTLFIVASTATKFILYNKGSSPEKRLARLLEGVSPTNFSGSKHTDVMDKFYIQIIRSAAPEDLDEDDEWFNRYQTVVGAVIVLLNPLPALALARLLSMDSAEIEGSLFHLHSLVAPSDPGMIFRIHHKSFSDFITNAGRIKCSLNNLVPDTSTLVSKFLIDTRIHHQRLATACFRTMDEDLKYNMANLLPGDWYEDWADVSTPGQRLISDELAYAVVHWPSHVHAAGTLDVQLGQYLEKWASTHMMTWLEVLCIIGRVEHAYSMLRIVLDMLKADVLGWLEQGKVQALISDASRFLLQSSEVLKLSPMHLYRSALPFVPWGSVLYTAYRKTKSLTVLGGVEQEWDPASLATITGHSSAVVDIAFSPDGSRLASASSDNTVRMWGGRTGIHIITLGGRLRYPQVVKFSPDGTRLVSVSIDKAVCLWDGRTGAHIITLDDHSNISTAVAFSPAGDGFRFASTSSGTICLWDGKTGTLTVAFEAHPSPKLMRLPWSIRALVYSPDGSRLVSASDDTTVRLWDGNTGAHIITLNGHSSSVRSVAFSPDGSRLASASFDQTIRLWDGKTYTLIVTLNGHFGSVETVKFSPNGARLASASGDCTIRLWDGRAGAHIVTLDLRSYRSSIAVAFSPDSSRLASANGDNTIRMWDVEAGAHITTLKGHSGGVTAVTFSPDGSKLASASIDSTIRLWDANTSTHTITPEGHSKGVNAIIISPDGLRLVSVFSDHTICLWDGKTGVHVNNFEGHSGLVRCVAFSPDASKLASASYDKTIRLWDGKTGAYIATLDGHHESVPSLAIVFSPDGSRLASASGDHTICQWDCRTGAQIITVATLRSHAGWVNTAVFSSDGSRLASAYEHSTIRQWDGNTGAHIATVNTPSKGVRAFAFSSDGSTLAFTCNKSWNDLCLWKFGGNVYTIPLEKHFHYVVSFAILPDTSTSFDVNADVFRLNPPEPAASDSPLRIILLGRRNNPSLWGLAYMEVVGEAESVATPFCWFPPHLRATTLAVDPTGSFVGVGCDDGRVLLLDISRIYLP